MSNTPETPTIPDLENCLNVHGIFRCLGIVVSNLKTTMKSQEITRKPTTNSANIWHISANPERREADKFRFSRFGDGHTW
jgi:hypothetical protein